jgi:hypothetical protein
VHVFVADARALARENNQTKIKNDLKNLKTGFIRLNHLRAQLGELFQDARRRRSFGRIEVGARAKPAPQL